MSFFTRKIQNQRGYSFIEILAVLAIMAMLTDSFLLKNQLDSNQSTAMGVVEDVNRIQRASMRFYRDNNAWPADVGVLVSSGYLTSGEGVDAWGNTYVLGVSGQDLSLTMDVQENRYVTLVSGRLPRVSVSGTVITSLIDKPGDEAAHDALYARDGSRNLTGPMDANGQNISNAGTITATQYFDANNTGYYVDPASTSNMNAVQSVRTTASADMRAPVYYDSNNTGYYVDPASTTKLNATDVNSLRIVANASIGGGCTTKSIGTTSNGTFVACQSGIWKTPGNQLPVGSIYISTNTTNPSSTLGYGSWTSFGAGRVLVGQNTADGNFDVIEEEGGAKTHTLSIAEMPSHSHFSGWYGPRGADGSADIFASNDPRDGAVNTGNSGAGRPHNNLQPYIVVKMWKRTG